MECRCFLGSSRMHKRRSPIERGMLNQGKATSLHRRARSSALRDAVRFSALIAGGAHGRRRRG